MPASVQVSKTELDWLVDMSHTRFLVSIRHEGCIFELKCLLLSYFRIGDHPDRTRLELK